MKNPFSFLSALVALHILWPSQVVAQPNLLVNGGFETQYASGAPTYTLNIKNASSGYYDELPNWLTTTNITSSTSNNATYVATNSTASYPLNPTQDLDPYTPHSGIGCVLLLGDHSHRFDGIIAQQVSLSAGHTYAFSYYTRRLAYSDQKNKIAFNIVYSNTVPGYDASSTVNDLVPTPSVRMRSDFITLDQWVQVAGSFIAPTTSTDAWVTLGFDNSDTQTDNSLPAPVDGGVTSSIHLALDDISLQDMGCSTPPMPQVQAPNWTCADGSRGPVKVYINNYDPALTYAIATTNNIRNSPPGIISNDNTSWFFQLSSSRAGATGSVTVTATNACGVSTSTSFSITSPSCGPGTGATAFTAYPNPATESLAVPSGAEDVVLFDGKGHQVQRADAAGVLNVRNLPAGTYTLQMRQNGELIKQRIELKH